MGEVGEAEATTSETSFFAALWCAIFHRKHHEMNTRLYGDQRLYGPRVCTKCEKRS